MPKKLDIKPGDKFGKLTVISEAARQKDKRRFLCRCDCGGEAVSTVSNLRSGHTKSCGCHCNEVRRALKTKHEGSGTRLYEIWQGIKKRCLNPNKHAYKYYGALGIKVCSEWLSFEPFRDWALGSGYNDNLTIERRDCNGNYEPNNCIWIPLSEQNNNKSNSRFITYMGKTQTLRDWSRELGINYSTLHGRLCRGWPVSKAFGDAV